MSLLNIKRYSRRVKKIKVALVVMGAVLVISIGILPFANPHEQRLKISYTKSIDDEGRMKLIKPVLYGMDGKRQAFKILAENGVQMHNGQEVFFEDVSGEIELSRDHSKIGVIARQCNIDTEENNLHLIGGVHLNSSDNYSALSEKVTISLRNNDIWSDMPIEIKSKSGQIKADTFYFKSNQKIMTFEGRVITIID